MKKGILFSVITLVFIILLATFSGLVLKESQYNTQIYTDANSIYIEKSLEEEIAHNILDIMKVKLKNITEKSVSFENFSYLKAHSLTAYENYLNNNYGNIVNQEINASLDNVLSIEPFGTEIQFGERLNVTTTNVESFSMSIRSDSTFNSFSEPWNDASGILVSIKFYNQSNELVNDTSITLDPTDISGNNFIWDNAGNKTEVSLNSNVLRITSNSTTNIYNFTINFDYSGNTRIYTGDLNLEHKTGKIEI